MKRLLLSSAAAAAIGAAGIPAIAGLAGNPSFSHKLPVRAPSQAQVVQFDDHGRNAPEPHHHRPATEPGDDRGGDRPRATEPGDDHGDDHDGGHGGGHGGGPGRH